MYVIAFLHSYPPTHFWGSACWICLRLIITFFRIWICHFLIITFFRIRPMDLPSSDHHIFQDLFCLSCDPLHCLSPCHPPGPTLANTKIQQSIFHHIIWSSFVVIKQSTTFLMMNYIGIQYEQVHNKHLFCVWPNHMN